MPTSASGSRLDAASVFATPMLQGQSPSGSLKVITLAKVSKRFPHNYGGTLASLSNPFFQRPKSIPWPIVSSLRSKFYGYTCRNSVPDRETMAVFVLQDINDNFLTKALEWRDDCSVTEVYRSPHKDGALNHLLEVNAKNPDLRARVVACEVDAKKRPLLPQKQSAA